MSTATAVEDMRDAAASVVEGTTQWRLEARAGVVAGRRRMTVEAAVMFRAKESGE